MGDGGRFHGAWRATAMRGAWRPRASIAGLLVLALGLLALTGGAAATSPVGHISASGATGASGLTGAIGAVGLTPLAPPANAALYTSSGEVICQTSARHTSAEFVAFLEDLVAREPQQQSVHPARPHCPRHLLLGQRSRSQNYALHPLLQSQSNTH